MTDRMAIGRGTIATIARAITRGIEATATTEIVRTDTVPTDTVRTDIDRTGIGRIDAETVIIEATAATWASVSGMSVGRTAGPAVGFRFTTGIDAFFHRKASLQLT